MLDKREISSASGNSIHIETSGEMDGLGGSGWPPSPDGDGNLGEISLQQKLDWFRHQFRPHFDNWVIGPIKRLAPTDDALVSFILMSCAIDYLAGFWYGKSTDRVSGWVYKKFVGNYFLPVGRYDLEGLYDSLRNGIVHMFTIKNRKYALKHNRRDLHLQMGKHNQLILNAEDFCADIIAAKDRYFNEVEVDISTGGLLDKAWERYRRNGFLQLVEV